jgi:hypothetical protein
MAPAKGRIFQASSTAAITAAFNAFAHDSTLRAIIISSDGFFQENRDFLIKEANGSGKYTCYPFQIYANNSGTHRPAQGRHTLHGPRLATAYYTLGEKAAAVIRSGAPSTLVDAVSEVHDR